ncbi:MAG TPA: hypothetical protein VD794_02695 [Flavisolibacter sp.]|nr:hypothetical protein [Flavisolibacter sp.]
MSRDKQTPRGERIPHPPSDNKPVGNSRQQVERERLELFSSKVSTSHRPRSERQIIWENDLYERQSI